MRTAIMIVFVTAAFLAADDASITRSQALLAQTRADIVALESQLVELRQLRQTVEVMTPLLADRSKALKGDVNGDGKRTSLDVSTVYCCKGCPATQPSGPAWFCDLDKDGDVDDADVKLANTLIK